MELESNHLVGPAEFQALPVADRFMKFAEAHRQSALDVCHRAAQHPGERTWPNSVLVRFHLAHALECFLKAGLWAKHGQAAWKVTEGHDLPRLLDLFEIQFESIAERLRQLPFFGLALKMKGAGSESKLRDASVVYRYPVDNDGTDWSGVALFDPEDTFEELFELGEVMTELEEALGEVAVSSDPIDAP